MSHQHQQTIEWGIPLYHHEKSAQHYFSLRDQKILSLLQQAYGSQGN